MRHRPMAVSGVVLALLLAGLSREAHAQQLVAPEHLVRPFRLMIGRTNMRHTFQRYSPLDALYSETVNPEYLHMGVSFDVIQRGKPGEQPRLFGALYYDMAVNVSGYGGGADGGSYTPHDFAYSGGGVAVRAHNSFGYAGAGVGVYGSGVGGKLFLGLQGRGSVFAEVSLTRTAHDPPSALTAMIGLRL